MLGAAPPGHGSGDDEGDDDGLMGFSAEGRGMSKEEQRQRDAEFKKRFRDAQPSVLELGEIMGRRARWFAEKCWKEYWERPWFWANWGKGWGSWQAQSSESSQRAARDR